MALADEIMEEMRSKKGKSAPEYKKEGPAEPEADVEEEAGDEEAIAGELADAVNAGDNAGIASALKSFFETCYPNLSKE